MKTQMQILRNGEPRRINCHPHERQFIANMARRQRRDAAAHGTPRPTLKSIRTTAAARYA